MARTEPSERFIPLGERLRALRAAAGITQSQLSTVLGWSHSAVADVEAGRRRLNVFEFVSYVRALGGDPSEEFTILLTQFAGKK